MDGRSQRRLPPPVLPPPAPPRSGSSAPPAPARPGESSAGCAPRPCAARAARTAPCSLADPRSPASEPSPASRRSAPPDTSPSRSPPLRPGAPSVRDRTVAPTNAPQSMAAPPPAFCRSPYRVATPGTPRAARRAGSGTPTTSPTGRSAIAPPAASSPTRAKTPPIRVSRCARLTRPSAAALNGGHSTGRIGSISTSAAVSSGYSSANRCIASPPNECPTRTHGGSIPAARSSARNSRATCAGVRSDVHALLQPSPHRS